MTTTAIGARDFYTTINNEARRESADEAAMVDKRTEQAWVGHENFVIIDNSTDFEEKMIRTIGAISRTLGLPKFGSIRKFLVKPVKKNAINLPYAEYILCENSATAHGSPSRKMLAGMACRPICILGGISWTTIHLLRWKIYSRHSNTSNFSQADEAQHVIRKTRRTFVYEGNTSCFTNFITEAASKFTVLQTKQAHADNEKFAAKRAEISHVKFH